MHPKYFPLPYIILVSYSLATILVVSTAYPSDGTFSHVIPTNGESEQKLKYQWKAFISYRRSFSKHLAMLTKVLLNRENVSTFIDVDDLGSGYWDDQLTAAIEDAPNFIIILSNGTLDRCIGDTNYTDVLHQEIKTAVDTNRNIVPIFDEYTHPNVDFSPEIETMMRFQGLDWNHSLVNATVNRLVGYLTDEPLQPNLTSLYFPNKNA